MTVAEWNVISNGVADLEGKVYWQRMTKDSPELKDVAALLKALAIKIAQAVVSAQP